MLRVEDLLGKGYFPKELPPPFTTVNFAEKYSQIKIAYQEQIEAARRENNNKDSYSMCVNFSIPKVGFSRRVLSIPNPLHQSILSQSICDHWDDIQNIYSQSSLSASKPVIDDQGTRAVTTNKKYEEFKKQCILDSYDRLIQLKTDISRYYPTIYTHVIPWAIRTKEIAKKQRSDSHYGNLLDKNVRNTQSGQTMGLPIGPDTSLIISEIIACKIDQELSDKFRDFDLKGARYFDDYFLYFSDYSRAEKTLKELQSLLYDYNLEINENKTFIQKFPLTLDNSWVISLTKYQFRENKDDQATDLYRYLSLAFEYALQNPQDAVLKYAVKCLQKVNILDDNWDIFESLLLKIALCEPSTLREVITILISNTELISKEKVRKLAEEIIHSHCPKGHSFEVAWSLWLLRSFDISLDGEIAKKVFESNDSISILIALDMKSLGLISGQVDISNLKSELTKDSFFGDKWLLVYESIKKGWLNPSNPTLLSENKYFCLLDQQNVEFYDGNNQIPTIEPNGTGSGPELQFRAYS